MRRFRFPSVPCVLSLALSAFFVTCAVNVRAADCNANGVPDELDVVSPGYGRFLSWTSYATTGSMTFADFDGDGRFDMASKSWNTNSVEVRRNLGDGKFGEPTYCQPLGVDTKLGGMFPIDLDRDGRQDLCVQTQGGVALLLGAGDGTLSIARTQDFLVSLNRLKRYRTR